MYLLGWFDLLKELARHGIDATVVRSQPKLSKILFDVWGLPDYKGNRSTDKECLHELAFIDPRAQDLKQFREALNCKKFIDNPMASVAYKPIEAVKELNTAWRIGMA
jgi:DNA polymerase I-like protein with 3'-5' exonuclease and polymerase domains